MVDLHQVHLDKWQVVNQIACGRRMKNPTLHSNPGECGHLRTICRGVLGMGMASISHPDDNSDKQGKWIGVMTVGQ